MTDDQISGLREKYRPLGIVKGREFLLPPEDAIHFLRDLAEMEVVVIGCELWQYVDRSKGWAMELCGAGGWVGDDRYQTITARDAAAFLEYFLVRRPYGDYDLVSFISRDVWINDWFV